MHGLKIKGLQYIVMAAREGLHVHGLCIFNGKLISQMVSFLDLKKTMAVLLESMLERLSRLENQVHHVMNVSNSSLANLTRPLLTEQSEDSIHAEGTATTSVLWVKFVNQHVYLYSYVLAYTSTLQYFSSDTCVHENSWQLKELNSYNRQLEKIFALFYLLLFDPIQHYLIFFIILMLLSFVKCYIDTSLGLNCN